MTLGRKKTDSLCIASTTFNQKPTSSVCHPVPAKLCAQTDDFMKRKARDLGANMAGSKDIWDLGASIGIEISL